MNAAPQRFGGLEGLRTIGVVAVFATHTGFATGVTMGSRWNIALDGHVVRPASLLGHLEIGPAIFFMISAFLLYRPFVTAAYEGRVAPGKGRFLRRRFVRVFPAYWLTLVALWALGSVKVDSVSHAIRLATLTQIYSERDFFRNPVLVPTWTLATELTFYFFLVAYVSLMHRRTTPVDAPTRLRRELIAAGVLCVFAVVWRGVVYALAPTSGTVANWTHVAEHWLPGTIDVFAVGLALAAIDGYIRTGGELPRVVAGVVRHPDVCVAVAIGWFLLVPLTTNASTGIGFSTGWDAFGRNLFQMLCAATLLLPVVFGDQRVGWYRRLVRLPFMAYVGLVSYGIYLWHDYWIVKAVEWSGGRIAFYANFWLVGIAAFVLSLACGAVSYHVIERPALDADARRASARGAAEPRPKGVAATNGVTQP